MTRGVAAEREQSEELRKALLRIIHAAAYQPQDLLETIAKQPPR